MKQSIKTQLLKPYSYLAVPLILMGFFFFYPLFLTFKMSLFDYTHDLYHPEFIGFNNYIRLFSSAQFWQAASNTLIFMLGVVPAMMVLPILLAILVNGNLKGIQFFRVLIYLPVVVSMVVVGLAWKWMYAKDGIINHVLNSLHLPAIDWLVSPDIALYAVMIVIIWKGLAYYMMMYLAQLQSVPQELYEAAKIDGANALQSHWHVTLPHLRPTLLLVAIISTIGSLKVFTEIYVMTGGGPIGSTRTLVYYIYERAFENLDLGIASAAGLILMGVLLLLSLIQIKYFQKQEDAPKPSRHQTQGNTDYAQ